MSFIGYLSSPISIPPTFDTTPCLEHLTEYEDCVIDVNTPRKEFLMPAWPTLWPNLENGKRNVGFDSRPIDMMKDAHDDPDQATVYDPLSAQQKQLPRSYF